MSLSAEVKKQAQKALTIKNSQVPLHRAIDILATESGDIPTILNRFRDIKEPDLRRALHQCADLLRLIEREAGLTPAWEAAMQGLPTEAKPGAATQSTEKPSSTSTPATSSSMSRASMKISM